LEHPAILARAARGAAADIRLRCAGVCVALSAWLAVERVVVVAQQRNVVPQ
jgi:hypothetical protein